MMIFQRKYGFIKSSGHFFEYAKMVVVVEGELDIKFTSFYLFLEGNISA